MWTKARSVAAIENRLPDAVTVEVAFKRPVFLPGTVAFADAADGGVHTFSLTDPRTGRRTSSVGPRRPEARPGSAVWRPAQRSRSRMSPSWATVATSVPSSVKTRAVARPRPPTAVGDTWS